MPVIMAIAFCFYAVSPALGFAQSAAQELVAVFAGKLDTKSAKAGDPVVAKTVKPAKLNDGAAIPKGTQLIGRVVAVQSRQEGKGTSKVAIKFESLAVKDGAGHPVQGRIAAIGLVTGVGGDTTDASLMARGGPTSTSGLSPQSGSVDAPNGNPGEPGAVGSSLQGVILGLHLTDDGANELEGVNRDIKLDSSVMIKVELE